MKSLNGDIASISGSWLVGVGDVMEFRFSILLA